MHNNSFITLSENALHQNLKFLRQHIKKGVIISSVVKGNAYGHDIETFVTMALSEKVKHFSVFDSQEAKRVKAVVGDKASIMIMGWLSNEDLEWAINNDVSFYVFEQGRLEAAIATSKRLAKKCQLHIEVETGMNRTGFQASTFKKLFKYLLSHQAFFEFKGLCTHYAGAESIANYYRIKHQMERYEVIYTQFCAEGLKPEMRHTACSAAALMYPETQMDMVRIGIMQYGFWPSAEVMISYFNQKRHRIDPLKRILSWKSLVMSENTIKRGEFVGYGTSFMANENMRVAVVPVGYAHGYSRTLSNLGRVLIHGTRCAVVGSINMNMLLVDISAISKVKVGDEVVLIGTQGTQAISVASFSDYSNMLNYELLTRISSEIPRKAIQ